MAACLAAGLWGIEHKVGATRRQSRATPPRAASLPAASADAARGDARCSSEGRPRPPGRGLRRLTTCGRATGSAASTSAPSPTGSSRATSRPCDAPYDVLPMPGMGEPLVTWSFPTTIVFGAGAVSAVGEQVKRLGAQRALVVCDPGVVKRRHRRARSQLARARRRSRRPSSTASIRTPSKKNVPTGVAAFRAHGAECIVAVGGGSPLDVGKLIALKVTHERPLADYDDAIDGGALHHVRRAADHRHARPPRAPAARSAAPASSRSAATGRKTVIFCPHLLAKVAILDPELTRSMPARVTAATGFDALTHCLEAYLFAGRSPDGRRHRARGPRALRGNTSRARSSTATISWRAAA